MTNRDQVRYQKDTNIPQQGLNSYLYPSSSRRKPAAVPGRGAALLVLAERKLTSYVYAIGKQPASNL
ncbi:hypothetical protein TIFTF001_037333 [Ficus carica]|uniref:Uncharacterized protein n=1 Tax=Ficus carica TaxID=3494 RepID=A0AA88E5Z2_FICCA|nr:hypothetical protein TIFTF001_037333 [Ficus carica]